MKLPALETESHQFCLLELDQPLLVSEALASLNPSLAKLTPDALQARYSAFLSEAMSIVSPDASGVILSPEVSYYALAKKAQQTGVVFSLEKQTEAFDPFSLPPLLDYWGVVQSRHNYAAAKLRLPYHPQEKVSLKKRTFALELCDYAHHEGIAFILELEILHEGDLNQALLQAIDELRSAADLFVLPPTDSLTAVTVTAELDVPWIMVDRTAVYERFKEQLRVCLESGAAGFLGGVSLWGDVFANSSESAPVSEWQTQLKTNVRDRFLELARITKEAPAIS